MTEYQSSVVATDLTYSTATDVEEGIESFTFYSLERVDEMIDNGEIDDGQSLAALYLYKRWLAKKPRNRDSNMFDII